MIESPPGKALSDLHHTITDTASDAIITIDKDSTILFVNQAAEKIFGYSRDEMLGQSLTMLIPNYLRNAHKRGLQTYLETGTRHMKWEAVALPGLHKSGREIPLELSFGEIVDDGNHYFTGIARDVTERHKLERRLTVQFQVARILSSSNSLVEAAPALLQAIGESLGWEIGQLWSVDYEAEVLRWVASWHPLNLSQTQFEETSRRRTFARGVGLPGRIWASGVSEWIDELATDPNFPRQAFAAEAGIRSAFGFPIIVGSEVSGVLEFFNRTPVTFDELLMDTVSSLGNQIGQFVERKRVEQDRAILFEREQRARLELEAAMQRMGQVQTVTEVALAHLSLDKLLAELIDRVRETMDVDTVAILLLEADNQLVAWATKGLELDVRIRVPLGAGFGGRVAAQKSPIVIDDIAEAELHTPFLREHGVKSLLGVPLLVEGRVLGVIHVGRRVHRPFTEDDTRLLQLVAFRIALAIENARLFEQERGARRDAEAASRAKDEFLTTISHELRTPLTPIIGWTHMLRNSMLPPRKVTYGLEIIERNSYILKRLINDLLDMSAILSGKMRMEELPVSVAAVLREAVETVRPIAAASEVQLDLQLPEKDEVVMGDRARLLQVFWNLLSNAIKFSTAGGKVRVSCEHTKLEAVVWVEDSGQGIDQDFLPYVFERFRQADGSKTRAFGGLGLGLALVKSFVQAHRGTVEAYSQGVGHGSKFTVRLPLQAVETAAVEDVKEVETKLAARAHLLVVEDDSDTLEMLRATLEAKGFQVTHFESATDTLKSLPENSVDLIISDIGMPAMDGLELIKRLRQIASYDSVPAIALTGYASKKDANKALEAGFNAHVSKPVNPAELISMIKRLLADQK